MVSKESLVLPFHIYYSEENMRLCVYSDSEESSEYPRFMIDFLGCFNHVITR